MKNRLEYGSDGRLDEVVTDAGMHLENLGENNLFLCGYREDGSSIALHIDGRVCLVEERPAPDCAPEPEQMAFGRISVSIMPDGDVVMRRAGLVGRGGAKESRMWCVEQVEAAVVAARARLSRPSDDAVAEVRALQWALQRLRARGRA